MKKIDRMISDFQLDKKMDHKKVKNYFKTLKKKVLTNYQDKLKEDKKMFKGYDSVLKEYGNLDAEYHFRR